MNLSASIVDTQLQGIVERAGDRLKGDENRKRSAAFVALCVKAVLALDENEALDRVTDGAGDAGIDAIDLGDIVEGEITVTVFQGKYKLRNDGDFAFPADEIGKLAASVAALFDPNLPPFEGDVRLKTRVEEVRSLVREGVYPTVRVILCSNGRTWDANGGQTCWTIHRLVGAHPEQDWSTAQVLVRVYEVGEDDDELVQAITVATNSQSPVEIVDLHANDPIQVKLEQGLKDLGYTYLRKRGQRANGLPTITPEQAAAAVLAVWRGKPHLARFATRQHFGRLYDEIFDESLLPVQVVAAVLMVNMYRSLRSALPEIWTYGRFHLAHLAASLLFSALPVRVKELEESLSVEEPRNQAFIAAEARFILAMMRDGVEKKSLQAQSAYFRRPPSIGDARNLSEWLDDAIEDVQKSGGNASELLELREEARLRD